MPFGVRYVAREIFRALRARFPQESEENVLRVAGHVVYYRFLQPAILCVLLLLPRAPCPCPDLTAKTSYSAPETYDIVEGVVPPIQRQNLGEVGKLLHQISIGRLFEQDQAHLQPMNEFVASSWGSFRQWLCDGASSLVRAPRSSSSRSRADRRSLARSHPRRRRRDALPRRRVLRGGRRPSPQDQHHAQRNLLPA